MSNRPPVIPEFLAAVSDLHERSARRLWCHSTRASLPPGTVVFSQDTACETLLVLVSGSLRLRHTAGENSVIVGVETGPAVVVTLGLLDGGANCLTGIAERDCEIYTIQRQELMAVCARDLNSFTWLVNLLCRSMRFVTAALDAVALGNVQQRLARVLVETAGDAGSCRISLMPNQDHFARRLGTAREVVCRNLKALERRGLLLRGRGEVTITDIAALRRFAGTS